MGEVILLLVILLISSTDINILNSQGPNIYKHIGFVSSVRKKCILKIVIKQHKFIMFSSFLYYHLLDNITNVRGVHIFMTCCNIRYTNML